MAKSTEARYVIMERQPLIDTTLSEHTSYAEAQDAVTAYGRPGKHLSLYIVDRSKNTVAEEADETESNDIARRLELAKQRKELLDLEEENNRRISASHGETKVG